MNTPTLLAALLCCLANTALLAQVKQFSYISDRTFASPDELMGYDFKPAMREVPGQEPEEFPVGKYSFGITRKNLYVEGPSIRGVYSVNNINTTPYGFILKTMNARDPTIQGHLKLVVDDLGQVEGLIFKRSTNDDEVIFFLRVIPEEVAEAEAEYFTHKGALTIKAIDTLWTGVEIRPFLRIYQNMGGIQERIIRSDSVSLRFYDVVTVEEKEKKSLLGKKRKARGEDDQLSAPMPQTAPVADADTDKPKRKFGGKIRGLGRKRGEDAADPGAIAQPTPLDTVPNTTATAPPPTEVEERLVAAIADTVETAPQAASLEEALGMEFDGRPADSLQVDSLAAPMLDSTALADTLRDVKVKITTEYFVDLNSFMRFDDGTASMQHKTFKVNGVLERENPGARKGGDRYQWELNLHKQPNAYIYLDEKRRVNSVQIDGQKFYMRGQ